MFAAYGKATVSCTGLFSFTVTRNFHALIDEESGSCMGGQTGWQL